MILRGRVLLDPSTPPEPGWVAVDGRRIVDVGSGRPPEPAAAGDDETILTPGFIDAHLHLPQFSAIGCDGLNLLAWLDREIYPAELRWGDPATTQVQLDDAHRRLLHEGTLGYAGYLTSHFHAVGCALESLRRVPLRAIVGQVLMDRAAPAGLLGQAIVPLRGQESPRITLSANPRFAVSCSMEMLKTASGLAGEIFPIQTHLAESPGECQQVRALFPDCPTYAEVYDRAGLLTPRALLAHGVHLSDEEWSLLADRRCVVIHCPAANTFLKSGLFDLRAAREHGVRLGVGSDVAAGPDLAMPRVARAMIEVAKHRRMAMDRDAPVPTPAEAWSMITRGNADVLGWPDEGRIEPGAAADLLILRVPFEPDEHFIGRLLYTWDASYITGRVLAGELQRAS